MSHTHQVFETDHSLKSGDTEWPGFACPFPSQSNFLLFSLPATAAASSTAGAMKRRLRWTACKTPASSVQMWTASARRSRVVSMSGHLRRAVLRKTGLGWRHGQDSPVSSLPSATSWFYEPHKGWSYGICRYTISVFWVGKVQPIISLLFRKNYFLIYIIHIYTLTCVFWHMYICVISNQGVHIYLLKLWTLLCGKNIQNPVF